MPKTQALKLIAKAYAALDFLNDTALTHYLDHCYAMAEGEERSHRKSFSEFRWGLTVKQAAQLFVVQRIAQAVDVRRAPLTVADILRYSPSVMYAAAIAARFGADIREAFALAGVDTTQLAALDYAQLVEVPEQVPA